MTHNKNKPIHKIEYYDKEKTKKYYEYWILNDQYHREDGPAYIGYCEDGSIRYENYYINNKLHREDGPAFIKYHKDGSVRYLEYHLNGEFYKKEIYLNKISPQNRVKVLLNETE